MWRRRRPRPSMPRPCERRDGGRPSDRAGRRRGLVPGDRRQHGLRGRQLHERPPGRRGARHEPDSSHAPARLRHQDGRADHVVRAAAQRPGPRGRRLPGRLTRSTSTGDFTTANGQPRRRLAAYDTATGQLSPRSTPRVRAPRAGPWPSPNDTVYVGGGFAGIRPDGSRQPARRAGVGRRAARLEPERRLHRLRSRRSPKTARRSSPADRSRTSVVKPAYGLAKIDASTGAAAAVERDARGSQRRARTPVSRASASPTASCTAPPTTSAPVATSRDRSR